MSKLNTFNAEALDTADELSSFRQQFLIPPKMDGDQIYFLGNSLGLQPRSLRQYIDTVLKQWEQYGVEGFFMGDSPWLSYHEKLIGTMSELVGAKPSEISIMNQLTVNLHLLMVSFYRPTAKRYKIIMEGTAFPSDQYAMESQVLHHGFKPEDAII
ncbi:MAG: kynureninase, partial [Sphingobacteriales bacterium]